MIKSHDHFATIIFQTSFDDIDKLGTISELTLNFSYDEILMTRQIFRCDRGFACVFASLSGREEKIQRSITLGS